MTNYSKGLEGDGIYQGTGWRLTRIIDTAVNLAVEKMKTIVPDENGEQKPVTDIINKKVEDLSNMNVLLINELDSKIDKLEFADNVYDNEIDNLKSIVTQLQNKCVLLDQIDDLNSKISNTTTENKTLASKIDKVNQLYLNMRNNYTRKIDVQNLIANYVNTNLLEQNSKFQTMFKRAFLNDFYDEILKVIEESYLPKESADVLKKDELDQIKTEVDNKLQNYLSKEEASYTYTIATLFDPVSKASSKNSSRLKVIEDRLSEWGTELDRYFGFISEQIDELKAEIAGIKKVISYTPEAVDYSSGSGYSLRDSRLFTFTIEDN